MASCENIAFRLPWSGSKRRYDAWFKRSVCCLSDCSKIVIRMFALKRQSVFAFLPTTYCDERILQDAAKCTQVTFLARFHTTKVTPAHVEEGLVSKSGQP
jgi:hypothetical protein